MLWHWRAVEDALQPGKPELPVRQNLLQIFGPSYAKYFREIPSEPDGLEDLLVDGTPYYALDAKARYILGWQTEMRQKALEWLCGDESWEDTTADT